MGAKHLPLFIKPEADSGTDHTTVNHPDHDLDLRVGRHKALFRLSQKAESSSCAQWRFFQKCRAWHLIMTPKITEHMSLKHSLFLPSAKWASYVCRKRPVTSCYGVSENLAVPQDECFRIAKNYYNILINLRRTFGSGLRILQWTNICWRIILIFSD